MLVVTVKQKWHHAMRCETYDGFNSFDESWGVSDDGGGVDEGGGLDQRGRVGDQRAMANAGVRL